MRKRKKGRKFNRERDQRKAFIKLLASNLIIKERIITTEARAKEVSPWVEKMITKSKTNNLASIRMLNRFFPKEVVKKMISEIGPRYKERTGGYTRIIKLPPRKSDGAKMAIIELVK